MAGLEIFSMSFTRVKIGVRSGFPVGSSCPFVICSLFRGNVTLTISLSGVTVGSPYTVALTAIGTDRPTPIALSDSYFGAGHTEDHSTAGYAAARTVTGLDPLTRYTWTATQTQNGVPCTETGTFMSAPGVADRFRLFFGSCDSVGGANGTGRPTVPGAWQHVKDYIDAGETLPVAGIFWSDDLGYVDGIGVYSDDSGHQTTGMGTFAGVTTEYAYNYVLAYFVTMGLVRPTTSSDTFGSDIRTWGQKNVNIFPQFGDHEFNDDFGWDASTASDIDRYNICRAVWDALLGSLQPAFAGSLDTAANHWAAKIGCVNLFSPDYITNADGISGATYTSTITTLLGSNQIDDLLAWRDSNPAVFNLFGLGFGTRYLDITGTYYEWRRGAQHPIADHCPAEYSRLFTAKVGTYDSIMKSSLTNGNKGCSVMLHGDYHHSVVYRQQAVADVNNHAEMFYDIHNGSWNGYGTFDINIGNPTDRTGLTHRSMTYCAADSAVAANGHNWSSTAIDVYGDLPVKEMCVTLTLDTGVELWSGKWVERMGNEAFSTAWSSAPRSISNSGGL